MALQRTENGHGILDALREKRNVMTAIMLRDMRTRFFNHGLGFLLVPIWPLAHMLILLTLYTVSGRRAPFGDNLRVFFASGLIPTLSFMYISRYMAMSLASNRPLLHFPVVRVLDVAGARATLEVLASCLTVTFILTILWLIGDNPMPHDPYQAAYAYLSVLLLAAGMGTLVSIISMFFRPFAMIYSLSMIVVYLTSGTMFLASSLPDSISYYLSFNPALHAVEWMRLAYYEGYSDKLLSREYLIGFGLGALCIGLVMERTLRRIMLEG